MRSKVFIGYRRADEAFAALLLYSLLLDLLPRDCVFLDTQTLGKGDRFPDRLDAAIQGCDIFFAVIGPDWDGGETAEYPSRLFDPNDYVRREVELALKYSKRIVPLFVQLATFGNQKIPLGMAEILNRHGAALRTEEFVHDAYQVFVSCNLCSQDEIDARSKLSKAKPLQTKLLRRMKSTAVEAGRLSLAGSVGAAVYDGLLSLRRTVSSFEGFATFEAKKGWLAIPTSGEIGANLQKTMEEGKYCNVMLINGRRGQLVVSPCGGNIGFVGRILTRVVTDVQDSESPAIELQTCADYKIQLLGITPLAEIIPGAKISIGTPLGVLDGTQISSFQFRKKNTLSADLQISFWKNNKPVNPFLWYPGLQYDWWEG